MSLQVLCPFLNRIICFSLTHLRCPRGMANDTYLRRLPSFLSSDSLFYVGFGAGRDALAVWGVFRWPARTQGPSPGLPKDGWGPLCHTPGLFFETHRKGSGRWVLLRLRVFTGSGGLIAKWRLGKGEWGAGPRISGLWLDPSRPSRNSQVPCQLQRQVILRCHCFQGQPTSKCSLEPTAQAMPGLTHLE